MKFVLLTVLGIAWAIRIAAFKVAAERGVPPAIVVQLSVIGILVILCAISLLRWKLPLRTPDALKFYVFSGCLGFILPFALETVVAGKIPAFMFVVIIATMPVWTLLLSVLLRTETASKLKFISVAVGFLAALLIAGDGALFAAEAAPLIWIAAAFLVPVLYTLNTVFIAARWPQRVDAIQIATGQAATMSIAAVVSLPFSGLLGNMWALERASVPVLTIVILETMALLLYLLIVRRYGATFVAQANYVSMFFAAVIGFFVFFEQPGILTIIGGCLIAYSLRLIRLDDRHGEISSASSNG